MDKYIAFCNVKKCFEKLEIKIQSANCEEHYRIGYLMALDQAESMLRNEFAAKGKLVKAREGTWSKKECKDANGNPGYRCSVCGGIYAKTPYCGGCGSKMRE